MNNDVLTTVIFLARPDLRKCKIASYKEMTSEKSQVQKEEKEEHKKVTESLVLNILNFLNVYIARINLSQRLHVVCLVFLALSDFCYNCICQEHTPCL